MVQGKRAKICVVGAGQTGNTIAMLSILKRLGDVHLFDVLEGVAHGKALDLSQLAAAENADVRVTGSSCYEDVGEGVDVTIVTAGLPRKDGMSRDDVLHINSDIIVNVARLIKKYSPNSFVICLTNPLDSMARLLQKETGFPPHMVVGMAGLLDGSRFKAFLAEKLEVSADNISTMVLGGHGDLMVPLPRYTTVCGVALPELVNLGWITQAEIDAIVDRTKFGGGEIIREMKASAFNAPAAAAVRMVEAYLMDRKILVSACAYLNGEYSVKGQYVGVPVVLGGRGVEKIVQLQLSEAEEKLFRKSIDYVAQSNADVDAYIALKKEGEKKTQERDVESVVVPTPPSGSVTVNV